MSVEHKCPKCGEECYRDEVDVGVGIQYGPWGCPACCWSSDSYYDKSNGTSQAEKDNPGWYVDNTGGMQRISAIVDKAERFGIPREVVEKAFEDCGKEKNDGHEN